MKRGLTPINFQSQDQRSKLPGLRQGPDLVIVDLMSMFRPIHISWSLELCKLLVMMNVI